MTMMASAALETAVTVDQALDQLETRWLPLARYAGVELVSERSCLRYLRVLLLLIVSAVGCRTEEEPAPATGPKVTVAHPIERQLTDEDDFKGWLQASEEVELRARVRGHIQKIHFRDGDLVERGQLLFELDPRPFQASSRPGHRPEQFPRCPENRRRQGGHPQRGIGEEERRERAEASKRRWPMQDPLMLRFSPRRKRSNSTNWTWNSLASRHRSRDVSVGPC